MRSKILRQTALLALIAISLLIPGVTHIRHAPAPLPPVSPDSLRPAGPAQTPAVTSTEDAAPLPEADEPATGVQPLAETSCPLCGPARDLAPTYPAMRGSDVGELQVRLAGLGYYRGPQDWTYNGELVEAVRAFQRDRGLEDDAVVDGAVWNALDTEHEPAFTTAGKPAGTPLIVIDIDKRRLSLYFDSNLFATFPVAVGKPESPTPIGEWHIADKDRNWGTGFGSRFMKLDIPWGVYGIHGTNKPWSIGAAMSGGCIRMHDRHVERVYELVKVGTKVRIIGTQHVRRLCRGDRGSDVMEVQAALAEAGYFSAEIDGFFGGDTDKAVLKFQRENGLVPNGQIDTATYNALGM